MLIVHGTDFLFPFFSSVVVTRSVPGVPALGTSTGVCFSTRGLASCADVRLLVPDSSNPKSVVTLGDVVVLPGRRSSGSTSSPRTIGAQGFLAAE
jgi:hypothetical protein